MGQGTRAARDSDRKKVGSPGPRRLRFPLLRLDAGLAAVIPDAEKSQAEAALMVPIVSVPRGPWAAPAVAPGPAESGLLVISGQLMRRVEIGAGRSVELVGQGDLLRPWQEDASSFSASSWEVLGGARLAVLDADFTRAAARWPELQVELLARALRRARFLASEAAVANSVGVDQRVLTLLWHLAEKWGRVDSGAVIVTIKLTHEMLADLIGARRPTVSTALKRLRAEGAIERLGDGCWALHQTLI
jgi:CRP-like cAMP-binding protein